MRKVLASIGILTAERVVSLLVGAVVSVFIARTLGPDTFGLYAFITSAVAMVVPLLDVGQTILVRDLVTNEHRRPQLLASAMRVAGVVAVALQGVAVLAALALPQHLESVRGPLLVAAIGLLARPVMVLDYWFQYRLDARGAAVARLVGLLAGNAARIAIAVAGGPHVLPLLALSTVLESVIVAGLMLRGYHRGQHSPRQLFVGTGEAMAYFRRIFPLLVAGLSIALYMRMDQVLLGLLADADAVGQYAAAVRLSEFSYFLPVVVMTSLAPALAAMHARSPATFAQTYERVVAGFAAAAFVCLLGLVALSPWIVGIVYGPQFQQAGDVLRVHVLSLPFVFLGVAQTAWTAVHEQQKLAMWRTIWGAVLNGVLNVVLIPGFGALGAAYATIAAYAFSSVLANALSAKTRPFFWMQLRQLSPWHLVRNLRLLRADVQARLGRRAVSAS